MDNRNSQHKQPVPVDAFAPAEVAGRLEAANVRRADLPVRSLIVLGLLGGLYIGFGGALATLVLTENGLGYGLGRMVAGLAFSLGLFMLVVAGGELFTGNNLMILAYAGGKISTRAVLRNWGVVFAANAVGAITLALTIHASGVLDGNAIRATAIKIAEAKAQLDMASAFLRGILCNMLVCIAVWLSVAARSVEGKAIAIALPIGAFVALGFEHCVANLYLLPIGMLSGAKVGFIDFFANFVPVTLGNIAGGVVVAAAYYLVYLGGRVASTAAETQSRSASSTLSSRAQVARATADGWMSAAEGEQRGPNEPAAPVSLLWRVSASAGWPAVTTREARVPSTEAPRAEVKVPRPSVVTKPVYLAS